MEDRTLRYKGLSPEEAAERVAAGKVNITSGGKTKSVKRIFYDNICTMFNLINVVLFLLLLFVVGSYRNLLFIGVVFCNTIIGIVQELRSKKSVDSLSVLTRSRIEVLRGGEVVRLSKDEIVQDDVILLSRGNQVPADCMLLEGSCRVNESLLTGESDLIEKREGDELLSGSFIAAGSVTCRAVRVGADSYAAKINAEAKYIKKNDSQILQSFKWVIKICTAVIIPVGSMMFISKYFVQHAAFKTAVESTVRALIGMIPGGMILLTSSVLAVSVIRLAKKKVLVNEMYCIETLARVDVLCLDKTGTLTADAMHVHRIIPLGVGEDAIGEALRSVAAASGEINATLQAIIDHTGTDQALSCRRFVPFSSETKWSGGSFENGRTYIIGAPEFIFADHERYAGVYEAIGAAEETVRIIALAETAVPLNGSSLPDELQPMALVLIKDTLRDNVCETINYFKEQDVALKVISGDSVRTVQNIALETGIDGAENAVDMTAVTTDEQLYEAAERCSVFGRVTPAQKKKLVTALQQHGHKVAMTGDGVNDVLALKEADCSVAMAAGSEAARSVSQLVLVDNDFASMPHVVAEGRRTINNIERSSSLYLVKTLYSIALSVFFIFSALHYPFQPLHLTLIGGLSVGFPSFVLALQPNKNIVRGNFTVNIIARAAPAAACIILNVLTLSLMRDLLHIDAQVISTIAVYTTALICLMLIVRLSIPINLLRAAMLTLSTAGFILAFTVPFFSDFFMLAALHDGEWLMLLIFASVSAALFHVLYSVADRYIEKCKNRSV